MMNHKDFPSMTEEFDRRVRDTLDSLPVQPKRVRRFTGKRIAAVGLAAALCLGGTAFAASDLPQQISRQFQLLFQGSDEALLRDYTVTPAPGALMAETDEYRVSVESVLFDESAGAGVVSLHLEDKRANATMPFGTIGTLAQYKGDDLVWSNLAECIANEDGQLAFEILYGDADSTDWCAGKFYLDESRSTGKDYYIEGAFIPVGDYRQDAGPLRLEITEQGEYTTSEDGEMRLKQLMTVTLPAFEQMPYYRSADGMITLSQIGLRVYDPAIHCMVDELDYIAVKMKNGETLVVRDEENQIDRTLYALGQYFSDIAENCDVGTYVLAKTFDLKNVQAIVLNDTEYPLSD